MSAYLFVTGKLAAKALKKTLERMKPDFEYGVCVLSCSVAALMNTAWISDRLPDTREYERVMIPGLCAGDLEAIREKTGLPVVRGPNDLKDLPVYFGGQRDLAGYGPYDFKIVAEIVEAHEMCREDIFQRAEYYRSNGADIIDLGCPPQGEFKGVDLVVAGLKERGFQVSLDTFDLKTALAADEAGLDMLLSVNSQNLDLARRIKARVVVIPDFGQGLESLLANAARLEKWGLPFIMDPILDPICFGFTRALKRFMTIRERFPQAEILMGLGNLTELLEADSLGVNALMAGVVTELDIDYVLTTEVISWARGSVRELDLARRLMFFAREQGILPKRIDDRLIALKDPPFENYTETELREIQEQIKDRNYRIFTNDGHIYVFNRDRFICGRDPRDIFQQLDPGDPSHAFYLGRELEKAALAMRLGKRYIQDQSLRWGYLDERP